MRLSAQEPLLLLFISLAFIVSAEHTQPEGVVCRSYKAAKENGMLETCEKLWRQAETSDRSARFTRSLDCRACKHLLQKKEFSQLAKILTRAQTNIDAKYIEQMSMELKNSSFVCALLSRCRDDSFTLPTLRFSASSTCDDCKKIVDDIRVLIEDNATKSAIATYVKAAVCVHLPLQIVDVCKRTVDSYIGVIMDLAASELESGPTCALFGLCPGELTLPKKCPKQEAFSWINRPAAKGYEFFHSRLSNTPVSLADADTCTDCNNVFSRIRDQTKDPEFDTILKNTVKDRLCEPFGYFKSMCESIVSKQVDQMIDNAGQMNITELCVFFNQCHDSLSPRIKAFKEHLKMRFSSAQPLKPQNLQIPVICEFCEAMIKRVLDLTINNKTEAYIMWALEESCSVWPEQTKEKCRKFIEDYAEVVIKAIIDGTAPKVICMAIGVCGPMEAKPIVIPMSAVQGSGCKLCEVIVDTIYQNLESNSTKEEIIAELETVCGYLPYIKDQCKSLVDNYASQVIDLLIEGVPSKQVCQTLGFCPPDLRPRVQNGCAICEVVFVELYEKLRDNLTISSIEGALENVCKWVPTSLADQCRSVIEENTAKIIDLVMQQVSPKLICQELGICYPGPPKNEKCEICKQIITFIYTKIEDDATADEIEQTLESVCDYFPSEFLKSECHQYVKAYTPVLIDLLVNNVPPQQVCQTIGLCPSDLLVKRLCAGGPVAWCRDKSTAELCDRTAFCRDLIWRKEEEEEKKTPIPAYPLRRPSIVEKYDCSKLKTTKERCSNERLMRLCGYDSFCTDFKRPLSDPKDACRFCRNLMTQRLTYGVSAIDCSIYVNPYEKARCEKITSLKLRGRTGFYRIDTICEENGLCDAEAPKKASLKPTQLLGDDPCLWGPSVSCRDADIASRCGVTAYCQQNVWSRRQSSPGLELIDCSRPLADLCTSPSLRYCGQAVLDRCKDYVAPKPDDMLRQQMCKDRPVSFCTDAKMVKLCGMGEYCEAMGMTPTPSSPVHEEADPRCLNGPAFVCQSYETAELCGQVEMCSRNFWAAA